MKIILPILLLLPLCAQARDPLILYDDPTPPWMRVTEPYEQRELEYRQEQLDERIDQIQRERAYENTMEQINRYYDEMDQRRLDAGMREDGQ